MIAVAHITATPPGTFAGNVDWFTNKHPDYAPHDLVDPSTHEEMQFVDYALPSKALLNQPGGVETNNRPGGVYQCEIVADEYCTNYPDKWYAWLDQWLAAKSLQLAIPYTIYPTTERFTYAEWMNRDLRGWYRHINVPENDHRCSWLLDLSRLAQPKEVDIMPEYVIRNANDLNTSPWLAVYPTGRIRSIGGSEHAHMLSINPKLPFVDEHDTPAYQRALHDAGL